MIFTLQSNPDKKLRTYTKFKSDFHLKKYLIVLKDVNLRKKFTKLRISAHNLYIEVGRHKRPKKTPEQERLCDMCKKKMKMNIIMLLNVKNLKNPGENCLQICKKFLVNFEMTTILVIFHHCQFHSKPPLNSLIGC